MGNTIRVLAVISKKTCIYLYVFLLSVMFVLNLSVPFYLALAASIIFYIMIKEDWKYQTIDMRFLAALGILFLCCFTTNIVLFFIRLFVGYAIFEILRLLSTKMVSVNQFLTELGDIKSVKDLDKSIKKADKSNRLPHGYLPIFAISLFIYLFIISFTDLDIPEFVKPTVEGFYICRDFLFSNAFFLIILFVVLASIILFLQYRIKKAIQRDRFPVSGYGNGDPFFLSIFTAVLGFMPIMGIFTISILISLLMYFLYFLRKDNKNDG